VALREVRMRGKSFFIKMQSKEWIALFPLDLKKFPQKIFFFNFFELKTQRVSTSKGKMVPRDMKKIS